MQILPNIFVAYVISNVLSLKQKTPARMGGKRALNVLKDLIFSSELKLLFTQKLFLLLVET